MLEVETGTTRYIITNMNQVRKEKEKWVPFLTQGCNHIGIISKKEPSTALSSCLTPYKRV